MAKGKVMSGSVIVTYFQLDGACAAAAALLGLPEGRVVATSARGIGETMAALEAKPPAAIHVCGVGVACPVEDVTGPAARLTAAGTAIHWHCGRGYLDTLGELLAEAGAAVHFRDAATNTAALAAYFGVAESEAGRALTALAAFDANLAAPMPDERRTAAQRDWQDLVAAGIAQYLKYRDSEPYARIVHSLAMQTTAPEDGPLLEQFRLRGHQYRLHGRSAAMTRLKERITKCADADRNVLITGESGVGKEHVAHLLWERSRRSMSPLIPVNCALYAGSANLANSDLFGHKRGAFTGANADRPGKFVEADGGILFLDELGELPLDVQAKLLRVLEDGWVTPEGADRPTRKVDVRIIAATNRDLPGMIRDGSFREDLYHRLSTLRIPVPPLRERLEDLDAIVAERAAHLREEGYAPRFTADDFAAMRAYAWPGNVRQLIKVVERAVMLDMAVRTVLDEDEFYGPAGGAEPEASPIWPRTIAEVLPIDEVNRQYARRVWELHQENFAATARALGVTTNTLRYTYLGGQKAGAAKGEKA